MFGWVGLSKDPNDHIPRASDVVLEYPTTTERVSTPYRLGRNQGQRDLDVSSWAEPSRCSLQASTCLLYWY